MDVGSKIGLKMRLAIKVKLREMGCYVDDELPDYVMVMVANKRTRVQMEEDLLLFLGDNTEVFVNWLHQVLKKLQEVTITAPIVESDPEQKIKPETSKDKEKKEKTKMNKGKIKNKLKKADAKKSKKKDREKVKDKEHKRRSDKKSHKKKKKSKDHSIKRPNIPPLLMNMEKDSEPSITDVFAGQILKNHGILLENVTVNEEEEQNKNSININLPLIDPNLPNTTINESSQSTNTESEQEPISKDTQLMEINEIELKIQGLKQKLAEELEEGGTDDEDFVNIRTENEELIADFADDVLQEIKSTQPIESQTPLEESETPKSPEVVTSDSLPQIELQLPKRPIRSRLGELLDIPQDSVFKDADSCERFTPDRQLLEKAQKSLKDRLGSPVEKHKKSKSDDKFDESTLKKNKSSRHGKVLESHSSRVAPASIVRVRPRPRPVSAAPASNLLFRAVADANRSMHNTTNISQPQSKLKQALVLPMPRGSEAQKIMIQVPGDSVALTSPPDGSDCEIDIDTESLAELENLDMVNKNVSETEYVPAPLTRKVKNTPKYVPTKRDEHENNSYNNNLDLNNISIHTKSKESNPQFVVTLQGLDPNVFLAKKLKTEGLLEEAEEMAILKRKPKDSQTEILETAKICEGKKRLSDTSDDSGTQVIIKQEKDIETPNKSIRQVTLVSGENEGRKRKASPIVFDVAKKDKVIEREKERERTISTSSDNHVIITSNPSHKYDSVPTLSQQEKKLVPCRSFPACRFGDSCSFQHPPCKFSGSCSRAHCPYKHPTKQPPIASHVVPSANYKTISSTSSPAMCKYYPQCSNPACHFFHPKLCRYGKACSNKIECNFYHHEVSNTALKWRSSKV